MSTRQYVNVTLSMSQYVIVKMFQYAPRYMEHALGSWSMVFSGPGCAPLATDELSTEIERV